MIGDIKLHEFLVPLNSCSVAELKACLATVIQKSLMERR